MMKTIIIKNISFFDGESFQSNKHILIRKKQLTISDIETGDETAKVIDGAPFVAMPSPPVIKENIYDIFSFKFLNSFSTDFVMNGELFDKLPYNYIESASEFMAEKMLDSGSFFLFLNHLAYHMVKSSLLTVSTRLKNFGIKSSATYLYNELYPEQRMISEKENESFAEYIENSHDPYLYHHSGYLLDKKMPTETGKIVYYRVPAGSTLDPIEAIDRNDLEKLHIIRYEDRRRINRELPRRPNIYYLLIDDDFADPTFCSSVFPMIEECEEFPFLVSCGYQSYSFFNAFYKIQTLSRDFRSLKLMKNQLLNLSKFIHEITERKLGYLRNEFEANLVLFDTRGFSINTVEDMLELMMIRTLSTGRPALRIIDGDIV